MLLDIDSGILFAIQSLRSPFLDTLMTALTYLGNAGIIWIVMGLVLFARKNSRAKGAAVITALIIGLLVCNVLLKPMAARARPFDVLLNAPQLLIKAPADFSFPSGHAVSSFAACLALRGADRRLRIPAFAIAVLISFSRLYLFLHFPSDVAAGILIGAAAGLTGAAIIRRFTSASSV